MKTENLFCNLCSRYVNPLNYKKIIFNKGKKPVVVCKWCIEKIKSD